MSVLAVNSSSILLAFRFFFWLSTFDPCLVNMCYDTFYSWFYSPSLILLTYVRGVRMGSLFGYCDIVRSVSWPPFLHCHISNANSYSVVLTSTPRKAYTQV